MAARELKNVVLFLIVIADQCRDT